MDSILYWTDWLKTHSLRAAAIACIPMLLLASNSVLALDLELPEMGVPSDQELPRQKQRSIGAEIYQEIQKRGLLLEDRLVQDYLSHLGYRLVSHAGPSDEHFTFFVLNEPSVNAFATPGGYVGVHTGLILGMQSEAELAAVVAHEISHVTQQHLARAFGHSKASNIPLAIGLLAAILVGGASGEATEAILYGSLGASAQRQVNFTRSNEQEADRVGIALLARAGYDPHAMAETFSRMDKLARFQGASIPEFLRSHPLHSSRISDALARADQYPSHALSAPRMNFYLMRARIQVLTTADPNELIQHFRGNLHSGKSLSIQATQYGLALALYKTSQYAESASLLKKLIQEDGERIPYYLALAKSMHKLRGAASAHNVLNRALEIYPENLILSLAAIDIYITKKQYKLAEKTLRPLLNHHRDKPELYERLSRIAAGLNNPSEAYLARAEAFYIRGHLGSAIEQLEQAQHLPLRNENIGLRVASRLKQIKKELKEQNKSSSPGNRKPKS